MPYWIVSQSVLPLEFAHSHNRGPPAAALNGLDGLCADQEYRYRYEDHSGPKPGAGVAAGARAGLGTAAAGFGFGFGASAGAGGGVAAAAAGPRPARGAGVLLGPQRAVRGLGDVVEARALLGGPVGSSVGPGLGLGFLSRQALCRRRSVSGGDVAGGASPGYGTSDDWDEAGSEAPRAAVVQCGYSKPDRRAATLLRLRLRGRMASTAPGPGSAAGPAPADAKSWSTPFPLDVLDTAETELRRAVRSSGAGAAALGGSSGFAGDDASTDDPQTFVFGVYSTRAEAPFGRTKVVVVVDRYLLINCLGGSGGGGVSGSGSGSGGALGSGPFTGQRGGSRGLALEVRQEGYDQELFTVRPGESTPLCWRAPRPGGGEPKGRGCVQIRLALAGWAWSGRVSLGSSKSEVTLRLRNDRDQSVFFLLVQVVMHGPRVCVIFRGGGQLAPYRIENHTLDTLQVSQNFDRRGAPAAAPGLQLLPYHVAAYAWDEPMQPAELRLQALTSGGGQGAGAGGILGGGGMAGMAGPSGAHGAAGVVAGSVGSAEYSAFNRRAWREVGVFSFERLRTWAGPAGAGPTAGPTDSSLGYFVVRVVTSGGQRVLQIHDRRNLPGLSARPSSSLAPFSSSAAAAGAGAGAGAGMWTPPSPAPWGGGRACVDAPLRLRLRVESVGGTHPHTHTHTHSRLLLKFISFFSSSLSTFTLLSLPSRSLLTLSPLHSSHPPPPRSLTRGPRAPRAPLPLPARHSP